MLFETHTLPNGIRLIHRQVNTPVSHAGLLINTGTRDETNDEQGMAHFIEHVIFKGTGKRKAYHILNSLDSVGGEINAYTSKEETCIYTSFLNPYYDRAWDLLADIVFNSVFPEKELQKEKEIIYDEINQCKDTPGELIFDEFENIIFEGHPIGKNILGIKKNIKNFTKDGIVQFMNNNYHTDEMVISSVGSISMPKLVKKTEKYFGPIQANIRKITRLSPSSYTPQIITQKRSNHQAHILIGRPAYSFVDKERNTLALLNNILGGPALNCRLNMNIREKFGFCYSIDSSYTPYTDTGVFNIYFATDNVHVNKVQDLVFKELNRFKQEKMGLLQLRKAKNQLKGQLAIAGESKLNEMLLNGKSLLVYNKVDTLEEIYTKIDDITVNDIENVANDIFDNKTLSVLMYKNTK